MGINCNLDHQSGSNAVLSIFDVKLTLNQLSSGQGMMTQRLRYHTEIAVVTIFDKYALIFVENSEKIALGPFGPLAFKVQLRVQS